MGWFIGITGRNQSLKDSILSFSGSHKMKSETQSFFLVGGGHPDTTHFHEDNAQNSGWIASGTGISRGENLKLYNRFDWNQSIQKGVQHLHQINGHFAVCRWNEHEVELITDQLGIRNIFIHKGDDFVLFSTRFDWIKKLVPDTSVNWENFGSRWLAINQFSTKSFLHDIERLSQGGHAIINAEEAVKTSNKRWNYTKQDVTPEEVKNTLYSFTTLALNEERPLSVGLSGGIDSRTIFAALMKNPDANWLLHTFGEEDHPDMKTAIKLNHYYRRKHQLFLPKMPTAHELEHLIPDYVGQTMLTTPLFDVIPLQSYKQIKELGLAVIDGGLGEIGRRRYLVGLLLKARKALFEKNVDGILPFLINHRADIFTEEVNRLMQSGMKKELTEEIEAMPEINEIGIENWLDLFSIRTRVLNAGGPEQSRSDSEFMSYMPFIQPGFVKQVLSLPAQERKNAKLFRSIIKENAPELQKIPLIKGDYSYPYWMKDIGSSVWMRIKQKLGMNYESSLPVNFLMIMEEYVRDLYGSKSAQEFTGYDHQKIDTLITGFYDEQNPDLAHQLNWWLVFEVFRRL